MGIQIVTGSLRTRRIRKSLVRLLRENRLASFATVDARGRAYINTAYFAWLPDWSIVFFSYPDSTHVRNLVRNPSMGVAIFDSHQRWGGADRGLQMAGICRRARGSSAAEATRAYARRFPGFHEWRDRESQETGEFGLQAFRFTPHRVKLLDERSLGGGTFVVVDLR